MNIGSLNRNVSCDLVSCAKNSINYLKNAVDPKLKYEPYFIGKLYPVPYMEHSEWDFGDVTARFIEAWFAVRDITGYKGSQEIEEAQKRLLLSLIKKDGLCYRPKTPWSQPYAHIWDQGRTMLALAAWYEREKSPKILKIIEKMIKGVTTLCEKEGDCWHIPHNYWTGKSWAGEPSTHWDGVLGGQLIEPSVLYYRLSGDENALKLAMSLSRGFVNGNRRLVRDDGGFIGKKGYSHTHSWTSAAAGMLLLGMTAGKDEFIEWGKKVYDWIRARSTSFGWVCEHVKDDNSPCDYCEVCCIMDMIEIQVLLANAGHEEYWDDVEPYVRNQLMEAQFRITPRYLELFTESKRPDTASSVYKNAAQRLSGAFIDRTRPNDWFFEKFDNSDGTKGGFSSGGCCSAAGPRALNFVWRNIVTEESDKVRVNLAFSRETGKVKIISNLPDEGRLSILVKEPINLFVRLPKWADKDSVRVTINKKNRENVWDGGYLNCGRINPKEEVIVTYPLKEDNRAETIAVIPYETTWKGDRVIAIKPGSKMFPLYQRC